MNSVDLERAYDLYCARVSEYANESFNTIAKPYFEKRGYSFRAGGGWGFVIFDKRKKAVDEEDLPTRIRIMLNEEVPGSRHTLGDWMDNFDPGSEEKKPEQSQGNITEHWLFMEFLHEGDYPNKPYMPKVFHDFDKMKGYSAERSADFNKKEFPFYCSTYVKFDLF